MNGYGVKYKCYYNFKDLHFTAFSFYFGDFKDGFWINENHEFASDSIDNKYWIPPNQISLIERKDERKS